MHMTAYTLMHTLMQRGTTYTLCIEMHTDSYTCIGMHEDAIGMHRDARRCREMHAAVYICIELHADA